MDFSGRPPPNVVTGPRYTSRRGLPPFLNRNLPNWTDDAAWDTRWQPHGPNDRRRAVLYVRLSEASYDTRGPSSVLSAVLCARFKDQTGRNTGFWTEASPLLVRGRNDSAAGGSRNDRARVVEFGFDHSAILTFLRRFPQRISLSVEIYNCSAMELRAPGHRLQPVYVSELDVYDEATAVSAGFAKQLDVVVPLSLPHDPKEQKKIENGPTLPSASPAQSAPATGQAGQGSVSALVSVGQPGESDEVTPGDAVGLSAEHGTPSKSSDGASRGAVGIVRVEVRGKKEWLSNVKDMQEEAEDVHVMLSFYSNALPWWNGIVRHDFSCPWCNHGFRRLRTLLVHLQSEHQNTKLIFDSLIDEPGGKSIAREGRFPITLNVSVFNAEPVNRRRSKKRPKAKEPEQPEPVARQNSRNRSSASSDKLAKVQPAVMMDDRVCVYCERGYTIAARDKFKFCGEWCEVIHKKKNLIAASETDGYASTSDEDPTDVNLKRVSARRARRIRARQPLSKLSTRQRPKEVDFDRAFGRRSMYHIVSFSRLKKSHFDEHDPDSEDEVDHSWVSEVSEDYLKLLPVDPKHKVLWQMWNKFVFANGSPGFYGNQYSQHGVESFILNHAPDVRRLGLRLQFIAFVKALHIHGCLDAEALLAIIDCLDGHRKHRDCGQSRRPKPPCNLGSALLSGKTALEEAQQEN